jgi:hypothetical protein
MTTDTFPETKRPYTAKFSYSGLDRYACCPGSWFLQYGPDKNRGVPSDALILGSAAHEITAIYDNWCMARGVQTDITAAPKMFSAFMADRPDLVSFRTEIKAIFDGYVQSHTIEPSLRAVEKSLPEKGQEIPGLPFRGRLDQLYYNADAAITHRIRDRKTDGQIRSQADVDSDFQLSTQALLVARCYHVQEVAVEMDFLRYPGVIRRSVRTAEQIAETEEDVKARIAHIRSATEFPFTPGAHCAWCGHTADCPKLKDARESNRQILVVSREDAVALGEEMVLLDTRLGQIKDALKPWCSVNGNLELNGLAIGHQRVESYDYPAAQVESVLKSLGYSAILYMRTDRDAVEKLMAHDEKVGKALEAFRTDASYTQFRTKKIKKVKPTKGEK